MKRIEKALAVFVALISVLSLVILPVSASTDNSSYSMQITNSAFTDGETRSKDGTSKIYYKATTFPDTYQYVAVLGTNTSSSINSPKNLTWANGQYVDWVLCRGGISYSISNMVNEDGRRYVTLSFKRLVSDPSEGYGYATFKYTWSPDSTTNFAVPTGLELQNDIV